MSHDTSEVMYEYINTGEYVPQNVTHVRFHPSVTKIGKEGAFQKRRRLKEVVLNEGLTEIGFRAFGYCASLQSINIPSTVTKIDDDAFYNCKSMAEVVFNDGLLEMGECAFHDCRALQSIILPSTIIKIDEYSFYKCSNLREVAISDGLREIGSCAFANCSSLERIAIPSTVDEIGQSVFNSCNSLREVVLSDGLKKIGQSAFQHCTALQSIVIPSTVDEIDVSAFKKCTNLRDVVLNEGLKMIGNSTFEWCTSLEHITIPSTVDDIEPWAFLDCTNLSEVVIHNEGVQIGHEAFNNCFLERFKFPGLSTRLDNIIQAGQTDVEAKMDDILTVEWRAGELIIPAVSQEIEFPLWRRTLTDSYKVKLDKIVRLVRYYEIKEATTLFELALWKARINQTDISSSADREVKSSYDINRDSYRIEVPGPVKDTILQFIGKSLI